MINNDYMFISTDTYATVEECKQSSNLIKKQVKYLDKKLLPIAVVSASCLPNVRDK